MNALGQLASDLSVFQDIRRGGRIFMAPADDPGYIFHMREMFSRDGKTYLHCYSMVGFNNPFSYAVVADGNLVGDTISRDKIQQVEAAEIRQILDIGAGDCILCAVGIPDMHAVTSLARRLR